MAEGDGFTIRTKLVRRDGEEFYVTVIREAARPPALVRRVRHTLRAEAERDVNRRRIAAQRIARREQRMEDVRRGNIPSELPEVVDDLVSSDPIGDVGF